MKRTLAFHIGGVALFVVASLVTLILMAPGRADADVTSDFLYDLASDSLADWTEVSEGTGVAIRNGIKISSDNRRLIYSQDFADLETGNAFLVEAVMSTDAPARPAFGWVQFGTALAINFRTPELPDDLYRIAVRFFIDHVGQMRISLVDNHTLDELAHLRRDYRERYRVRVRLQQISGTYYLFLESEPASTACWENRDDTTDDPPNRAVVPLSIPVPEYDTAPGSVYFGNDGKTGAYNSYWENVHLTFTDDPTTLLPYSPTFDSDAYGEGDVCDPDDNDGIYDDLDLCPETEAEAIVDSDGCSIGQLCEEDWVWKNHGKYVLCVTHAAEDFLEEGLITEEEMDAIVSEAGQSDTGKRKKKK